MSAPPPAAPSLIEKVSRLLPRVLLGASGRSVEAIAELLTRMDMGDHAPYCNEENGGVILRDPRYKPRRYKAALYQDYAVVGYRP